MKEVGKEDERNHLCGKYCKYAVSFGKAYPMLLALGNNFESPTRKKNKDNTFFFLFHINRNQQHQMIWGRNQVMCNVTFIKLNKMLFGKEFAKATKSLSAL